MLHNRVGGRGKLRRDLALLTIILVLGLAARILYLQENVQAPDFEHPDVDALTHDYWARGLATGEWSPPEGFQDPRIRETAFFRPPGYPYFLALVYRLTGGGYVAPRLVQMFLGLLSAVLAFLIGRRWFGAHVGHLAAAGISLYWGFIYFEGELHAPALLNVLLLGSIYLLGIWNDRKQLRFLLAGGVVLGLAALVRPNVLVFVPVAALWSLWAGRGVRRRWLAPLAMIGAVTVAILPATVRNAVVAGDLVLISSNSGINLYIGNSEGADGSCPDEIPGLGPFGTCFDYPGIVSSLGKKLGRQLKHSEVSDWFAQEAIRFIRNNPGEVLRLLKRKFFLFWGPVEVGHNKEVELEREHSRILKLLPGNFTLALTLGLVGAALLILKWRRQRRLAGDTMQPASHTRRVSRVETIVDDERREPAVAAGSVALLVGLLILVLSFSILPFFVAGRYRIPIVPFLLLFAAYALYSIGDGLLKRRYRNAAVTLAASVVLYVLLLHLPQNYEASLPRYHYLRGVGYLAAEQSSSAEAEFRKAIEIHPQYAHAQYNLGAILADKGQMQEAVGHWQMAIRLRPDLPEPRNNLGAALLMLGNVEEARIHLQGAVDLRPESPIYRLNLAKALMRAGRSAEAVSQLEEGLRLAPDDAEIHRQMGTALQTQGQVREALVHFRQALRLREEPLLANNDEPLLANKEEPLLANNNEPLLANNEDLLLANNIAWMLSTHQDARQRDASEAVRLATQVCETSGYKNSSYLDTLAAAYAEAGRFEQAVDTVERAIELARASGQMSAVEKMRRRLRLYEVGTPYRDPSLTP